MGRSTTAVWKGFGTPFPVLRDLYYVQAGVDVETKTTKNVLLRRGKEWHGPDRTLLNASQIVPVEPVTKESRVAALGAGAEAIGTRGRTAEARLKPQRCSLNKRVGTCGKPW